MSVWLCIPSKRPAAEAEAVLSKWREMGYKVAIWRDEEESPEAGVTRDRFDFATWDETYVRWGKYRGYAWTVNALAKEILDYDPDCSWIVAAGDDTLPDPNKRADEIAAECSGRFYGLNWPARGAAQGMSTPWEFFGYQGPRDKTEASTFGVMQPTGDPWSDRNGRLIERIAGSPWLGREWCLRANGGQGPLWPKFFHMFADETLQQTALALGVFWQRPDLTHLHHHWGRPRQGERIAQADRMPDFLERANSPKEWRASKAEFERLKANGFKECFPK